MNLNELQLRKLIRKGINIVLERKKQSTLKENRLRNVIRDMIAEVERKTAVADKVIHKNTGINVLDDLLKRIISQIEDAYTNLSSNDKQRKSFRHHFLYNFKNALAPVDANRTAPVGQLNEQDFTVRIEDDDDELTSAPDAAKFIPARPKDIEDAKEQEEIEASAEEEGEFVKLDTDDPDVRQGAEEAEKAWRDVQNQIVSAYERLINPNDAAAFKDWGLTNLKLYFDKFEGEMSDQMVDEPESPDYPPAEGGETTADEETFEI
mgnify:CR=1 FL=1